MQDCLLPGCFYSLHFSCVNTFLRVSTFLNFELIKCAKFNLCTLYFATIRTRRRRQTKYTQKFMRVEASGSKWFNNDEILVSSTHDETAGRSVWVEVVLQSRNSGQFDPR